MLSVLFTIILNVIFPVFLLMGMGIFLHRLYTFDLNTLSKITTFYLLPVVGFTNIYNSQLNLEMFAHIIGFQLMISILLMIISAFFSKILKLNKSMTATFKNSIVLMNSGNYGLPVSQLVFRNEPIGLTIQIIIMMIQNFITYTYGLMNSVSAHYSGRRAFLEFLKMPMLYALVLGLTFQFFQIEIPQFLWNPIKSISDSFLAMALLALGAQVAFTKVNTLNKIIILSVIGRLIISPLIALMLIYMLGLSGTLAKGVFIASSYPSSRNSAQLALEYDNYPEVAGQIVLLSTILSVITVTFVVYLSETLF